MESYQLALTKKEIDAVLWALTLSGTVAVCEAVDNTMPFEVSHYLDRIRTGDGSHFGLGEIEVSNLLESIRRHTGIHAPVEAKEDPYYGFEDDVLVHKLLRGVPGRDPKEYSAMLTVFEANWAGERIIHLNGIIDKMMNRLEDLERENESLRATDSSTEK